MPGRLLEVEARLDAMVEARRREIQEAGRRRVARIRRKAAEEARRWRGLAAADREEVAGLAVERALRPPGPEAVP